MSDQAEGPGWWQASDSKWYPPQPPSTGFATPALQQKKSHGCLYAILAVVGVIVVIGVISAIALGTAAKKVSTNAKNGNLGGPAPAAQYKVGDTASTSDYRITLFGVKDPQPPLDQFDTPRAGDHFVSVDVQVMNPGSSQKPFSSLIGFHLLDSLNRQYDETIVSGLQPGAPDGQIAGGQSVRGFVSFEVPDGTAGLKLRVQGSLTAAGAVFNLG